MSKLAGRVFATLFTAALVLTAAAPSSIREVDLRNFSYPFLENNGDENSVRWIPTSQAPPFALQKGRHVFESADCRADGRCPLMTLDSIQYGKFSGTANDDAIVVLSYSGGGSGTWQYLYFLSFRSGKPEVIALLGTGSRSFHGLSGVNIDKGDVVLEVNDPAKAEGSCCSSGVIRTRYHWQGNSFQQVGSPVTAAKKNVPTKKAP